MQHAPRACLMGHQVAYSRSPMLHGYWLRSLSIGGSYDLVDIAPAEFPDFLRGLREHGFAGGNITKPHKATAFRLVDRREPAAEETGAVNCVWYEGATLVGGNTDVIGYLANLDDQVPGWDVPGGACRGDRRRRGGKRGHLWPARPRVARRRLQPHFG